ncbi:MAG: class I SAM-dependent methyltransferase [Candidatus Thermoplasmatota archaeon]|nr:class I SAM-dependent methyltransferase [Candidatus Thermoplasmatota archaeon]
MTMRQVRPADIRDIYALRAETIDYFFPDREEEIDFWADLIGDYGEDVLHLLCGTAEISMGLAKRGFNVTGLDLTEEMIYVAEDKVEEEKENQEELNIELVNDDARYFNINKKFNFSFISTGDFHHFKDREDINSVLAKTYAHLRSGGAVALELFPLPDEDFHREEKKFDPMRAPPNGMDIWKTNQTSYHLDSQILEIKEELFVDRRDKGEVETGEYEIQLKLFSKGEIKEILQEQGFENIEFLDNHEFTPYLKDSDTLVVTGER